MTTNRRNTRSESSQSSQWPSMPRREFMQLVATLGALGYIDGQTVALALNDDQKRIGWLANRTAAREGAWKLTDIEGKVPAELNGTLFRTAPGQSENHGVTFKHLFDGDAFVSGYSIRDGQITLRAKFVETPQRQEEIERGRMLYDEFGTHAPALPAGEPKPKHRGKNQASVNIIPWDGKLLGLSEGWHPTAIDAKDFSYIGDWDFYGTLPQDISFTAHPKYDPTTGEAYAYGMQQGPTMALTIFRMEPNGKLQPLYAIPQPGFFMLHDMLMSKNYLIFAIPPVKYHLGDLLSGKATPGEALRYFDKEPLRFLIVRRDGTSGKPVIIEQPANMVFHNGNAFEQDGKLVIDTLLSPDDTVLKMLGSWGSGDLLDYTTAELTRLILNPETGVVESRTVMAKDQEFPRFDIRRSGQDARYLYVLQGGIPGDPLALDRIVRHDLHNGKTQEVSAGNGRVYGESVFVAKGDAEDQGWLLTLGYDGARDQTFLDIRDAASLELEARAWTGSHFPLGFHGNFQRDAHVAEV